MARAKIAAAAVAAVTAGTLSFVLVGARSSPAHAVTVSIPAVPATTTTSVDLPPPSTTTTAPATTTTTVVAASLPTVPQRTVPPAKPHPTTTTTVAPAATTTTTAPSPAAGPCSATVPCYNGQPIALDDPTVWVRHYDGSCGTTGAKEAARDDLQVIPADECDPATTLPAPPIPGS